MPRRPALPISLYVEGQRVVITGDGPLAAERARRFRAAGARAVTIPASDWTPAHAEGARMVVCTGTDLDFVRRAAAEARAAGCPLVYAQDAPDQSDMAMPALVTRGPLKLAISTDGVAPALARRFREELERLVNAAGERLDRLLAELERLRDELPPGKRQHLSDTAARMRIDGRIDC